MAQTVLGPGRLQRLRVEVVNHAVAVQHLVASYIAVQLCVGGLVGQHAQDGVAQRCSEGDVVEGRRRVRRHFAALPLHADCRLDQLPENSHDDRSQVVAMPGVPVAVAGEHLEVSSLLAFCNRHIDDRRKARDHELREGEPVGIARSGAVGVGDVVSALCEQTCVLLDGAVCLHVPV